MLVSVKTDRRKTLPKISELKAGEVFMLNGNLYLKTNANGGILQDFMCVNISTGEIVFMTDYHVMRADCECIAHVEGD